MDTQSYISSGVIETYAMGLATIEETQILDCIQKHNHVVSQAVLEAQKTIEELATINAITPDVHLKNNIWNAIQNDDFKNAISSEKYNNDDAIILKATGDSQFIIKNRFKSLAIAASIFAIIGGGLLVYMFQQQGVLQNQIVILEQKNNQNNNSYFRLMKKWNIITNPLIKTIVLAGVEKHPETKAIVYLDKSSKQTYLSIENLPTAPKGYEYQLWAIVDGKPVDGGMCEIIKDSIQEMLIINNAQAFAITLERAGGSKVPTMDQMYVIGQM